MKNEENHLLVMKMRSQAQHRLDLYAVTEYNLNEDFCENPAKINIIELENWITHIFSRCLICLV